MRIPVAREGWPLIGIGVLVTGLVASLFRPLAYPLGFFTLFTVFFFRDFERVVPPDGKLVLAPADGTILSVEPVYEDEFLQGEARRVSIFMSVFSCHVNRNPIDGKVAYHKYAPGRFALAFKDKASADNENNSIGIEGPSIRLLVRQIAGLVARRIVWWVGMEDEVRRGERFGMIRFGSRVDIFLPPDVAVRVKKGDHVTAGISVIGELA